MTESTIYISFDNKTFYSKNECQKHECYQLDLQKRMADFFEMDAARLEKLISDLQEARSQAYSPGIVDTMGSCQTRALLYMKGVCQKFVDDHKNIKMI